MGAQVPFDIMPAVWLVSVAALTVGLLAAGIFEGWKEEVDQIGI